jgi:reactive intermediate/imine deaminase
MRIACLLIAVGAALFAQDVKRIQPEGLSKPTGYSQVVTVTGGKMVFIAGQVSTNAKGEVVGKGDLEAQTVQVFENLKLALAAAGASFDDVVKQNIYVVNMNAVRDLPVIRQVRAKYFKDKLPASTAVGVTSLASPDWLIEIEMVAFVKP